MFDSWPRRISSIAASGAGSAGYSQTFPKCLAATPVRLAAHNQSKPALDVGLRRTRKPDCTIFGHGLVNGVHSIENRASYEVRFFVDWANRRSKTIIVL